MRVIKSSEIKTSNWSGGETSELFIFPIGSQYKNLNFLFRLSKATIEVEHSVFTSLPLVKRELMVLSGSLSLKHKDHYTKHLLPFETDIFDGSWSTESNGKAADFNLMMLGKTDGFLTSEHSYGTSTEKTLDSDCDIFCIYIVSGKCQWMDKSLVQEDVLVLENPDEKTKLGLDKHSSIIIARLWLNE